MRLREGAPMPDGVRALIHDPGNPDAVPPSLRVAVPGLDRERLDRAVQAFGRGARVAHG